MDEELQKKTFEEVAALKDLFLRRLMDDKVKMAAIAQLKERNDALQRLLDEKAITSIVRDILLVCDRIDMQGDVSDFVQSIKEELLEILARRDFYAIPDSDTFDPSIHNAVGTEVETTENPEKSIIRTVRKGFMLRDQVFRPTDVIVAVKSTEVESSD